MKHLVILLVLGLLVTSFCLAQSPDKFIPPPPPPKPVNIAVTFTTNDTCYLRINNGKNYIEIDGKDYIKIVKTRTLSLPLGNYRLDFESMETGKIIKDRSFQLIKDSVPSRRYTYPVTFK